MSKGTSSCFNGQCYARVLGIDSFNEKTERCEVWNKQKKKDIENDIKCQVYMVSTIDMKINLSKMTNILNNDNDKKRQQTNKSTTTKTKK